MAAHRAASKNVYGMVTGRKHGGEKFTFQTCKTLRRLWNKAPLRICGEEWTATGESIQHISYDLHLPHVTPVPHQWGLNWAEDRQNWTDAPWSKVLFSEFIPKSRSGPPATPCGGLLVENDGWRDGWWCQILEDAKLLEVHCEHQFYGITDFNPISPSTHWPANSPDLNPTGESRGCCDEEGASHRLQRCRRAAGHQSWTCCRRSTSRTRHGAAAIHAKGAWPSTECCTCPFLSSLNKSFFFCLFLK